MELMVFCDRGGLDGQMLMLMLMLMLAAWHSVERWS
jgi:hypothetical protein